MRGKAGMGSDRRKQPRSKFKDRTEIKQEDTKTGESLEETGVAKDVSEGGLRVQGKEVFDPYREVEISFALGGKEIEAKGKVVHLTITSRGAVDMGIQFRGLSEESKEIIKSYCQGADAADEPEESSSES